MTPDDEDEAARDRTNFVVLAVAVVIVAIGIGLFWLLKHYQDAENCRIEARRDCDPIEIQNQ